jgi:signal transduction histidine kinase
LPTFETLLDRAVGEAVKVEVRRTSDLWYCKTDPHQLETAILNLAINARDAMEDRGELVLSTANVRCARRRPRRTKRSPATM